MKISDLSRSSVNSLNLPFEWDTEGNLLVRGYSERIQFAKERRGSVSLQN